MKTEINFNGAVSIDDMIINKYGAVGGMRFGRGN
jgi:hypothetical protein